MGDVYDFNVVCDGVPDGGVKIYDVRIASAAVSAFPFFGAGVTAPGRTLPSNFSRGIAGVGASIQSVWGTSPMSSVSFGGMGFVIGFKPGVHYSTFVEVQYTHQLAHVSAQPNSVLQAVGSRSIVEPLREAMYAPTEAGETDAARYEFVANGKHVDGLLARLAAFALSHALLGFTTRTRPRNATVSYFCTAKYRQDNIVHCLQDAGALTPFIRHGALGADTGPLFAVYVGDGSKERGMSLLSRICDAGGPMAQQICPLLTQFDQAKVLLYGARPLDRDFRAVQAQDLNEAISEALTILIQHNGCTDASFNSHVMRLIHNLPIVNSSLFLEKRNAAMHSLWLGGRRAYGAPLIDPAQADAVRDHALADLGPNIHDLLGVQAADLGPLLSNVYREVAFQMPADGTGTNQHLMVIPAQTGTLLGYGFDNSTIVYPPGLQPERLAHFSIPNAQPGLNIQAMWGIIMNDAMRVSASVSGAADYQVFFMVPSPGGGVRPVPPAGSARIVDAALVVRLDATVPPVNGSEWLVCSARGGVPPGAMSYAVIEHRPVDVANRPPEFLALDGPLRRFDVPGATGLLPGADGYPAGLGLAAVHVSRYLVEFGDRPALRYWDPEALRILYGAGVGAVTNTDRVACIAMVLCGLHYLSVCNIQMRDDYAVWTAAQRAGVVLASIPAEYYLWMGNIRVTHSLSHSGGLWTICYQVRQDTLVSMQPALPTLDMLNDPSRLANALLRLRASVEACGSLLGFSPCRLDPSLTEGLLPVVDAIALQRLPLTPYLSIAPETASIQQNALLANVFNNSHGVTMGQSMGRALGTMLVGKPSVVLPMDLRQNLAWMRPQVIPRMLTYVTLGIAPFTGRVGKGYRGEFAMMSYDGSWRTSHEGQFRTGIFDGLDDEIWHFLITSVHGLKWRLSSVFYRARGPTTSLDVSRVVDTFEPRLDHMHTRLLPNFRYGMKFVHRISDAARLASLTDPRMRPLRVEAPALFSGLVGGALPPLLVNASEQLFDLQTASVAMGNFQRLAVPQVEYEFIQVFYRDLGTEIVVLQPQASATAQPLTAVGSLMLKNLELRDVPPDTDMKNSEAAKIVVPAAGSEPRPVQPHGKVDADTSDSRGYRGTEVHPDAELYAAFNALTPAARLALISGAAAADLSSAAAHADDATVVSEMSGAETVAGTEATNPRP